jgi:hypothetical protein
MTGSIFVAAAPMTTWPLTMATFASRLRGRWPAVHTSARHAAATNHDYLAFELDLDGERRHGAYFDGRYLVLSDGTPKFWAETITSFLALLPANAQVVCMTETVPEPIRLPRQATTDQVIAVLDSLVS